MNAVGWREIGERLLDQAAAVRQAFPDAAAMAEVSIGREPLPEAAAVRAALGGLRDELLLVQSGTGAGVLYVLDDEAANAARELARLGG